MWSNDEETGDSSTCSLGSISKQADWMGVASFIHLPARCFPSGGLESVHQPINHVN